MNQERGRLTPEDYQEQADKKGMRGWYVARRTETIKRVAIYKVWADNIDDAGEKLSKGQGEMSGYLEEEVVESGELDEVHYDLNEGMGT